MPWGGGVVRGDRILAAEHALGLLEGAELLEARRREATDAAFAAEVAAWAEDFAGALSGEFDEVLPSPAVRAGLDRRLFGEEKQGGWSLSGAFGWLTAGLATAALAGVLFLTPFGEIPDGPRPTALAQLASEDGSFRAVAMLDAIDHKVDLAIIEGAPPEGRVFELWVVRGDLAPVSLGVVDGRGATAVVPDRVVRASGDVAFAVSLEPLGGSPDGTPSQIVAVQPTEGL